MSEALQLRPYQLAGVESLRDGRRNGHRSQILMSPCGSGKTVMAAHLLEEANKKYTHSAILLDRINLVDQTSALLDRYGIPHGVIQAGHPRRRPMERIQVCSAQTIEARDFFPNLKLLIVDEAHATRKQTAEFIKSRADMTVIGLTATPFTKGLAEIYTNLVNVCTTNYLIEEEQLVPLTMYAAKAVDMTGAKVIAGEWSEKEIEQRGLQIIGDIVSEWADKTQLHFGGPVKTIVFSATVDHGKELCRQFNAAGFNFQQISYKDGSDDTRKALIAEFRKPDSSIHGLVSCEVFTKGFDVPDILCGIGARPYRKSLSSHIQQIGRVMRTAPGKQIGLWLDHCGNVLRFKDDTDRIFQYGLKSLDDGKLDSKVRTEPKPKEREDWSCTCGYVFPRKMDSCPACGKERPRRALVENVAGVMEVVSGKQQVFPDFLVDRDGIWGQLCNYAMERKSGDVSAAEKFAFAQYLNLYGVKPAKRFAVGEPISLDLKGKVKSNIIRWAKGREKRAKNAGLR